MLKFKRKSFTQIDTCKKQPEMAALATLSLVGAVPFNLGPTPNNSTIAHRRRRHPAGDNRNLVLPGPQLPDLRNHILTHEDAAGYVAVALNEAGRTLSNDAATNTEGGHAPSAPPNSPATTNAPVFVFPEVNDTEDEAIVEAKRPLRPLRKRRRIPSFKQHRVTPKVPCQAAPGTDADDEDSDSDVTKASSDVIDSDAEAKQELNFKLRILAETQKSKTTDWSRVGAELRQIADTFQSYASSPPGGAPPGPNTSSAQNNDVALPPSDFLSLVNMFLPVSIPQSLWSAIVSYAAWKILKRL